jgi:replicative DNA helicase
VVAQHEVTFHQDTQNEQVILAAALVDEPTRKALLQRIVADHFLTPEHRALWAVLKDITRRQLAYDPATVAKLSGGAIDPAYLGQLADARPDVPENLDYHVGEMLWDKAKHTALTGPISALLEALQNPKETPERVRTLATQINQSLRGYEDRRHLLDAEELIRSQMQEIRARIAGHAIYPYGVKGLDFYEAVANQPRRRRIIPGAAPGQVTVVTGTPGVGKSTFTANVILGLARQKRKVLVGAWEMKGGMTLELLAVISLGWSRSALIDPKTAQLKEGFQLDELRLQQLEQRMREITVYVRFMANPFRRRNHDVKSASNEANLDIIEGYIADSGADVFVADLWKRCLAKDKPEDEERALYQQQTMAEELGVHAILVQQQRSKDVEARPDKRPTREGIKGSGTWTEVADTILGIHRPGLWKPMEDNVFEVDILKQRYGKWPLAVEFDWDGDRGTVTNARSIDYETIATGGSAVDRNFVPARSGLTGGKRR